MGHIHFSEMYGSLRNDSGRRHNPEGRDVSAYFCGT